MNPGLAVVLIVVLLAAGWIAGSVSRQAEIRFLDQEIDRLEAAARTWPEHLESTVGLVDHAAQSADPDDWFAASIEAVPDSELERLLPKLRAWDPDSTESEKTQEPWMAFAEHGQLPEVPSPPKLQPDQWVAERGEHPANTKPASHRAPSSSQRARKAVAGWWVGVVAAGALAWERIQSPLADWWRGDQTPPFWETDQADGGEPDGPDEPSPTSPALVYVDDEDPARPYIPVEASPEPAPDSFEAGLLEALQGDTAEWTVVVEPPALHLAPDWRDRVGEIPVAVALSGRAA